jgi:hypothetical protein
MQSNLVRYSNRADYVKRRNTSNPKGEVSSDHPAVNQPKSNSLSSNPISQTLALNKTVANGVKRVAAETLDQAKQVVVAAATKEPLKEAAKEAHKVAGKAIAASKSANSSTVVPTESRQPKSHGPIFINGFSLKSLSGDNSAMERMGQQFEGAKQFSWHQEDEILAEIQKMPPGEPLMIIGHSFGGDAAVSLANRLNSIEGGFKSIDLLVTLDSVGFDNDIIPPNVIKNMNFITDKDLWFNDGPNMARDPIVSDVENHLRPEEHIDIDDAKEVQSSIFHSIKKILAIKAAQVTPVDTTANVL